MATSSIGWPDTSWSFGNGTATNWASSGTNVTLVNVTWSSAATNTLYIPTGQTWVGATQFTGNYATGNPAIGVPLRVKTPAEIIAEEMAEKASQQLVRDLVGEAGYRLWKQAGYIEIDSKLRPGTIYRVKSDAIDLYERKDGKIIDLKQWLCVHPKYEPGGVYPAGDEVATRILLARFAEDDLWKTANLHHKRAA